jgi:tRNA G18 (ribose-2'-O)-methylase SpoU
VALNPIVITSMDDPRVDVYRDVRDADLRGRDDLFMAESELVIRRVLHAPHRLHSFLLSPEKYARLQPALANLSDAVPIYVADLNLMHEIAAFHIHRGVLAAGYRLRADQLTIDAALWHLLEDPEDVRHLGLRMTLLIAEGITNVDNMGALFRNAAALGVRGIVLDPTCCDPLYRKAIRVSMGHVLSIPYAVSANWPGDLERLKTEWGLTLIGAESHENAVPPWEMPKATRTGIVFGSEGHGLSEQTLRHCDAVCAIPMSNQVPSINVAVASAVMLYELNRNPSND